MTQVGQFVWTDLSTYDIAAARADYAQIFGWQFAGGAYDFATIAGQEAAALFVMPEPLAQMQMPSFWMSYVQVEDVAASVDQAQTHEGVIVEVPPEAFGRDARIALIRDPSGAGFTLYEGPQIGGAQGDNTVVGRVLHLPDLEKVAPFYSDLFGWRFERLGETPWRHFAIRHPDGSMVALAEEVPADIRGTFSYWMPCFNVPTLAATLDRITAAGGAVLSELTEGRVMVADHQGAHFLLRQGAG